MFRVTDSYNEKNKKNINIRITKMNHGMAHKKCSLLKVN